MPDKKPNDSEILNAAECCTIGDCRGCFYGDTDQRRCRDDLILNLVDLVNQKQAENEKLRNKITQIVQERDSQNNYHKHHKGKCCFLNHTILHTIVHLAFHLVLHKVFKYFI